MQTLISNHQGQLIRLDEFNGPRIMLEREKEITLDLRFRTPLIKLWGESFNTNSHEVCCSTGSEVKWRWSNVESYEARKFENDPGFLYGIYCLKGTTVVYLLNGCRSSALERNRKRKGPYIQSDEDLNHMVNEGGVWEITLHEGDFLVVPGHYYREIHFTSSPSYVWEGASFSMFSPLPLF